MSPGDYLYQANEVITSKGNTIETKEELYSIHLSL